MPNYDKNYVKLVKLIGCEHGIFSAIIMILVEISVVIVTQKIFITGQNGT